MDELVVAEPPTRLSDHVAGSLVLPRDAVARFGRVVYSSSLGAESAVLTDLIFTAVPQIDIFTVDTGRLPEPTLELLARVERRYERRIRVYYPEGRSIQRWVGEHGINGFYNGLEQRQGCCAIRKLEPFKRAVAGYDAWVTVVRSEQSEARAGVQPIEWDERYRMQKVSPLLPWTEAQIWKDTSASTTCPTTRCTMPVTRASVVHPVRAPSNRVKTLAPDAGGGKMRPPASAACSRDARPRR